MAKSYGGSIAPAVVTAKKESANRKEIREYIEKCTPKTGLQYIAVHCSATREGGDYGATEIDKWHKNRGFKKIGYHFVVRLDGTIERGRGLDEVGANVEGYNSRVVGICYIGGLDLSGKAKDTRTKDQKESLEWLIGKLVEKVPTVQHIQGHRDFPRVAKACPCFDAIPEYAHHLK